MKTILPLPYGQARPDAGVIFILGGNMYQSMHKTLDELIDVFETRGLVFTDKAKAKNKLKFINYYKLKELAYPFSKIEDGEIQYDSLAFEQLIERYYADKNLRFPLLQCIEKIEIAFKNEVRILFR